MREVESAVGRNALKYRYCGVLNGAHIIRSHDVLQAKKAIAVADAISWLDLGNFEKRGKVVLSQSPQRFRAASW